MRRRSMAMHLTSLALLAAAAVVPAAAQEPDLAALDNNLLPSKRIYIHDPRLPAWCNETYDGDAGVPNGKYMNFYGENFKYSHHHCRGLYLFFEASKYAGNAKWSERYYRRAVEEFGFLLDNTTEDYALYPEALVYRGMARAALGLPLEAFQDYERAVQLRPDYQAAYIAMSNLLTETGETDRARSVLETALARVPGSAVLRRKLDALDASR